MQNNGHYDVQGHRCL